MKILRFIVLSIVSLFYFEDNSVFSCCKASNVDSTFCSVSKHELNEEKFLSRMSVDELKRVLIPRNQWKPFPVVSDRVGWSKANQKLLNNYIPMAEKFLGYVWLSIPATESLEFYRTGSRVGYQKYSFDKRKALATLVLGELAENKGRFMDDIVNGIWSICEESWWGLSAHLNKEKYKGLIDTSKPFVELFAAETGSLLAWTDYLLREKLDAINPLIHERIYREIDFRLMQPLKTDNYPWMKRSKDGRSPNNWNPWICSNWITFTLLMEENQEKRASLVHRALTALDEYYLPFPKDGGNYEGHGYWNASALSVYDNVVVLNSATNYAFNYVLKDDKFANMGNFIYKMQISDTYFYNYADSHPKANVDSYLIYSYGRDICDKDMMAFANYYASDTPKPLSYAHFYRTLEALFLSVEMKETASYLPLKKDVWLPQLQVMIARDNQGSDKGFCLAAKGGDNFGGHNHNDIGSYVFYYDGEPVLIEAGSGLYTSKFFDPKYRYGFWFNSSSGHNTFSVNDIQQKAGSQYSATDVRYTVGNRKVKLSMQMKEAYPEEAGIETWNRNISLFRGRNITIENIFKLKAGSIVKEHFLTCCTPDISNNGTVVLKSSLSDKKFVIKYDSYIYRVNSEKVQYITEEDKGIKSSWGNNLYRITLISKTELSEGSNSFTICEK